MSVTKQNQIEHNDCLNLQLKLKEEKEYWEDKLLELKLKNCKTNFIEEKSSQNLKSKLLTSYHLKKIFDGTEGKLYFGQDWDFVSSHFNFKGTV